MTDPSTKHPYFKGATQEDAYVAGWKDSAYQIGTGCDCVRGCIWNPGGWPEELQEEYIRGHYESAADRNDEEDRERL